MHKDKGLPASISEAKLMLEAACVYRYAGRFREARDIFLGVRALLPTEEASDLGLAGVYMDEGKLGEAETHCLRALELNHASAAAYAQLAEIQLRQKDIASARKSIQKAIDINPNGPAAVLAKDLLKVATVVGRKR